MPPRRRPNRISQSIRNQQFSGPSASSILPTRTVGGGQVQEFGRQLSGQKGILREAGTDRALTGKDLDFGFQELQGLAEGTSIGNPFFTSKQTKSIEGLARTAAARGLRGGAVRGQLTRASDQFLAFNRAQNFANVTQEAGSRLSAFQRSSGAFLQQLGSLEVLGDNRTFGTGAAIGLGSGGQQELNKFAQPLFQALVSQGRQNALTAGLLLGQNADIESMNLSAQDRQIAGAVNQFLNPALTPGQQKETGRNISRAQRNARGKQSGGVRGGQTIANRFNAAALVDTRLEAGRFLGNILQQPLRQFQRSTTFLRGGSAPISSFLAQRLAGGAQQINNIDFSQFDPDLQVLTGGFRQVSGNFGLQPRGLR